MSRGGGAQPAQLQHVNFKLTTFENGFIDNFVIILQVPCGDENRDVFQIRFDFTKEINKPILGFAPYYSQLNHTYAHLIFI